MTAIPPRRPIGRMALDCCSVYDTVGYEHATQGEDDMNDSIIELLDLGDAASETKQRGPGLAYPDNYWGFSPWP